MTRTRATALALVNWKGVFYERYLLDRHVTALEGANGAGKTTVMIAAYVVLLPDMSRLRFTNLGETGAASADKGIWGRLGEPERPSYAALDVTLPTGERLVMGVHLERRAEPSVEPTPFLISELAPEHRLQDVLLSCGPEFDEIPLLKDVRTKVAELGANIEVFATTKEYFAALFERGVTPLRLASDEDRNKLNEMLRTSMTGGISRALGSELRSFLLKEETGLSDTLSRMRANLEACRRTRVEVAESRKLEHEINGVYDAGHGMFTAAVQAARARCFESSRAVGELQTAHDVARGRAREHEAAISLIEARRQTAAERRVMLQEATDESRRRVERIYRARDTMTRLRELETELGSTAEAVRLARAERDAASEARAVARQQRDRARADYERAARGVADAQQGLDEMHRRAHAFRAARAKLAQVTGLLSAGEEPADLHAARNHARERLSQIDGERARLHRQHQDIAARRTEYEQALAALRTLAPEAEPGNLHEQAQRELERLRQLDVRAAELPQLNAELERAERLARRQTVVGDRAAALGVAKGSADAARELDELLQATETEARAREQDAREHAARADECSRQRARLERSSAELETKAARWEQLQELLARLERTLGKPCSSEAELVALRAELLREREHNRLRTDELASRRELRKANVAALEAAAGSSDPELSSLRDELDAELLSDRFEDLDPRDAARVEAKLGALVDALVVPDARAAAERLAGGARERPTVWLVDRPGDLIEAALAPVRDAGPDVVVEHPAGVRVTRIAGRASLGRLARRRRADEIRAELARLEAELEERLEATRRSEAALAEFERAALFRDVLDAPDPKTELERIRGEREQNESAERAARESSAQALARAAAAHTLAEQLRSLLPESYLLQPPVYAERVQELNARRHAAAMARQELARCVDPRALVSSLIEALRRPPPNDEEIAVASGARASLDQERDRWYAVEQAVSELLPLAHALEWRDAEAAVTSGGTLLPALEAQLSAAAAALDTAEHAVGDADAAWEQRTLAFQKAEAQQLAAEAQALRLQDELTAPDAEDPADAALERALEAVADADRELEAASGEERAVASQVAVLHERMTEARRFSAEAERRVALEQQRAAPASAEWDDLRERAAAERLLSGALAQAEVDAQDLSSVHWWAEARSRRDVLCDRLTLARGEEVAREIKARGAGGDAATEYLFAWLAARDWLKRRLPAQVADVDDPLTALERLRQHLAGLEERLLRQETDLRGASEDVARSIEVQLRRAKAQVRRLNQHLEGVRFGSIRGIRVQMVRIERMDQILRALREGSAQELLFHPTLPIEDALAEIFRRFGGGKTGGQRLLDYREYIDLAVEIQRQSGQEWELANGSRLSTGEAIGVGAALMMVVLTEWERDANLLRPKQSGGSLRFLFLDEANRLSQDNLGVLFELCEHLDLQLLIAAPEVARAEGNTTYRLVRRLTEDGREEVIVSGRRTIEGEAEPQQLELLSTAETKESTAQAG
jgi:chromosome partition protein MukB